MADAGEPQKVVRLRPLRPCPECSQQSSRDNWPFCSRRCKDVDMNRWLSGAYVIPAREDEDDEQDSAKPAND